MYLFHGYVTEPVRVGNMIATKYQNLMSARNIIELVLTLNGNDFFLFTTGNIFERDRGKSLAFSVLVWIIMRSRVGP